MSEVFCTKWLNPRWQNLRWLPSSSWFRINEWSFFLQMVWREVWVKFFFLYKWWKPILVSVSEFERKYYDGWIQDGQIQDGRIQDGCHHEVRWEWMCLSQIELVWVSIRVEWEYFWVNLREDNKMSESKMAMSESNMAEFKKAAIIKLSENEWVKLFLCRMAESNMTEFKMAAIIKLIQNEWVKFFSAIWLNPWWQNSRWLHIIKLSQNEWVKVFCANVGNQSWQVWVTFRGHTMMADLKIAKFKKVEFKMAAII